MKIQIEEPYVGKTYDGEVEIIVKDINGNILSNDRAKNIVKIFAKEIISHRLPHSKVWNQDANSGGGAWVTHNIDLDEFSVKYIVFGASFDSDGNPLASADSRYYTTDTITGGTIPIKLGVGAELNGGLINAIPVSEPSRPLKRIERIYFETSYQPAGTPLLQDDVRAINNVIVFETTLRKDEYNGFGTTSNDFFTLTEVALVGGVELGLIGTCECDPHELFIKGNSNGSPLLAHSNGTATINLDISESLVDLIKEGDQIKIVAVGSTVSDNEIMHQISPYYLVTRKVIGGRDITLDRMPVDSNNNTITGQIGIYRDGFRIFSHRILSVPFLKNSSFEITVRWRINLG